MRYVNIISPGKESTYRVKFRKDGLTKGFTEVDDLDLPWVKKKIEVYEKTGHIKEDGPFTIGRVVERIQRGIFGLAVAIPMLFVSYLLLSFSWSMAVHLIAGKSSPEKSNVDLCSNRPTQAARDACVIDYAYQDMRGAGQRARRETAME
jgi:hypothetical protein